MKFREAWDSLSLEKKQAIAKRVLLNYILIIILILLPIFIIIGFELLMNT